MRVLYITKNSDWTESATIIALAVALVLAAVSESQDQDHPDYLRGGENSGVFVESAFPLVPAGPGSGLKNGM